MKIAVFDTETTGLEALRGSRICDFGGMVLEFDGFKFRGITSIVDTFINPGYHIPAEVSAIHHITDRMVENAMTYDSISPELSSFFQDIQGVDYLGAYNIGFDWDFVLKLYPEIEAQKDKKVCILKTLQKYYPNERNHQLQYIRYHFDLYPYERRVIQEIFETFGRSVEVLAHRALSDVIVTTALLIYLAERTNRESWEDFFNLGGLSPNDIMYFGKYKGKSYRYVVDNDPRYVTWLREQTWFGEKYSNIAEVFKSMEK